MAQKKEKTAVVVPKEEQPYGVPENWLWVRLGNVIKSSKDKTDIFQDNSKYVSLENIEKDTGNISFQYAQEVKSTKSIFHNGDILYGRLRPYLNKHGLATFDGICSTDILVFKTNGLSFNKFVNYFFNLTYFIGFAVSNSKGINLPRVSENVIFDAPFPLPPLPEQQRIVNIIESLFKDLDEAKERLLKVKKGFGERKAALLHKAFTGKLTEKWRERNGVGLESWENVQLGELTDIQSSKRVYKEDYVEEGIPFFRSSEVVELYDKGTVEPKFFISYEKYNQLKENYGVPQIGDMLVTSVGTIGKTWIVDERQFYYKDGNLTQVVKNDKFLMQYLQKYMQSGEFQSQVNSTVAGSAYNALTIVKFKNLIVPLPTLPEQKKIVSILNTVLSAEKEAEQKVDSVIEGIDLLKKSILARAFRGELGTNDPMEEKAI